MAPRRLASLVVNFTNYSLGLCLKDIVTCFRVLNIFLREKFHGNKLWNTLYIHIFSKLIQKGIYYFFGSWRRRIPRVEHMIHLVGITLDMIRTLLIHFNHISIMLTWLRKAYHIQCNVLMVTWELRRVSFTTKVWTNPHNSANLIV